MAPTTLDQLEVIGDRAFQCSDAVLPGGVELQVGPPKHLSSADCHQRVAGVVALPAAPTAVLSRPLRVVLRPIDLDVAIRGRPKIEAPSTRESRLRLQKDPDVARPEPYERFPVGLIAPIDELAPPLHLRRRPSEDCVHSPL